MWLIDAHTHNSTPQTNVVKVVNVMRGEKIPSGENLFVSVGVHPWTVSELDEFADYGQWLEENAGHRSVWAIGECGIDKRKGPSIDLQLRVFELHANVADLYCKPLIIHCVKAYNEIFFLRKKQKFRQPWMLHGFWGSPQLVSQLQSLGFYFSLGMNRNGEFPQALNIIPLSHLLLETDMGDLSIERVYESASHRLGLKESELRCIMYDNFNRFYNR
ncbi:MAG: TatD family hydrolase [Breznakibacter sp.]